MMLSGYEVGQELARNAWCGLYHGQHQESGRPVLLKMLRGRDRTPGTEQLLRYEYTFLQKLTLPGVVRVEALLHDESGYGLVYEDTGAIPLPALLPWRGADLEAFFSLTLQLTSIVAWLHQHGIVHQHLTPWSILLHPTTQTVYLADFSLASQVGNEAQVRLSVDLRHSALAYVSPEQTGRMNRVVDYRTDFYSLGILFYELLTGNLPFRSQDTLELMHWHIAKTPLPPADLMPEIPVVLSDLVLKLLAKTPEERYQSAVGLQKDLEQCAAAWSAQRYMAPFPLGQHDIADRFLLPQKLYGREREVQTLLQAFDTCCQGQRVLLLVEGYSGIGKTSLIQELYRPIGRQQGYFITGKLDQVVRSVPFGALVQAFWDLLRQLLSESEERLEAWRSRLAAALGSNGGVLTEVIPELALIIGVQPPAAVLGPTEALNRFQMVLQHFVGALAQPEHPLVVFLDDLQWADAATLSLLQPLLSSQDIPCLLLIGAYRDNEVYAGHPLLQTLHALETHGSTLQRVTLGPLQLADISHLLQDVMHGSLTDVAPLARVVLEKTAGNPFFVLQFLHTLYQDGYLRFDYQHGRWGYQLEQIVEAEITDNVIDLMTRKIQRLSARTQHVVTLAACIGNPFDRDTLAIVGEYSRQAVADDLQEALGEGVILPIRRHMPGWQESAAVPSYVFLHDRVQQAAYALIPAERQQSVHLTVGRLLRARAEQEHSEEQLFDIAHHLNLSRSLITDEAEGLALARINLQVGQKAKSATAYEAARDYLEAGLIVLQEAHWQSEYGLTFALHLEAASCHYLCGDFAAAEQLIAVLLRRASSVLDKARVYNLRGLQYENMARYTATIANARECLELFAVTLPSADDAKQAALEDEMATIHSLLAQRSIASLVELPVMTDPDTRMVMSMLTDMWASAYILGDVLLARLISAMLVRLSLHYGNVEESAYGYVTHAITVGPVRGDYQAAYEFGCLALQVNERFQDTRRRAKIYQQFHAHVNLWRQPMHTCIAHAREACRSGLEAGDFLYAAYGAATETWPAIVCTTDLEQFVRDYTPTLGLLKKLQNKAFADAHQLMLGWVRALQGTTKAARSLSYDDFDEQRYVHEYTGNPFFSTFYYTARVYVSYLLEDYEQALQAAQQAVRLAPHLSGTIWPVLVDFWAGLTYAACYHTATEEEQAIYCQEMERGQAALAVLAESCPENFFCQAVLLAAEIERLRERPLAAMHAYERALRYAAETHSVLYQALAYERYARFCLQRGQAKVAAAFLSEARSWYAQWGATAKVALLDQTSQTVCTPPVPAPLRPPEESLALPALPETLSADLDFATVMKATQAMTSEIELEKLLATLMRIAIENAGAERGSLLLEHDGTAWLYATGSLEATTASRQSPLPLSQVDSLPTSLVHYVRRTLESVVIDDARRDERYAMDPYIQRCQPRSLLCVPVRAQGRLLAVVYLEHSRISRAFSAARIQMMQMLSSHAAISLENALLYDAMKQEVAQRRQAEEEVRVALAEVEQLKNRLQAENVYLQEEIRQEHNFEEMVGSSPALLRMLQQVEQVAATDATVLVYGETGTGKELIARALHNRSARQSRPLVKVNCGAISAGLVESELFGHVKGAFTGALERRVGRFELANGGTIFLDEVGELPLDTQVKLLRVLQEQEFEPVGSSRTVRVDVRIIAATNRNLEEAVRAGRFRSDLFYRLNVFLIQVPPLRERRTDIPQLVLFFLSRFAKKLGKQIAAVAQDTMERLTAYSWPGNIRELQNLMERSVVLAQGPVLQIDSPLMPMSTWNASDAPSLPGHEVVPPPAPLPRAPLPAAPRTLEDVEKEHIVTMLTEAAWVIEGPHGAAKALNLHPNTLRSRMKKLGIKRPAHDIS